MMFKDFFKKAGILGVSFGLIASPLAFAQTDENSAIERNKGTMAGERPMDAQGSSSSADSVNDHDLTRDEGDGMTRDQADGVANSNSGSANDHDLTRDEGDGMTRYQEDGTLNSDENAADFENTDELPEENKGM
jgi:hypothetical protein